MTAPVDRVEADARREHAAACRLHNPDVTDEQIAGYWLQLSDGFRERLLNGARRRLGLPEVPVEESWLDHSNHIHTDLGRGAAVTGDQPDDAPLDPAALAQVKRGDRLDAVTTDGVKHELVVTDDPRTAEDGTVTFGVADAEAHAVMDRLGRVVDGWSAARDRRDAAGWDVLTRHADVAEDAGQDVRFEFAAPAVALEPHHAAARKLTDEEAAKLAELDANLAELRRRRPPVTPLHDNHLHISHGLSGVEVDLEALDRVDRATAPRLVHRQTIQSAEVSIPRRPSGGACCQAAYDSDGFAHDHEATR